MINIENEYRGLMAGILYGGSDKEDRTGTGTKSVFGRTIRHDMSLGFPILTGKKISLFMVQQLLTNRYILSYTTLKRIVLNNAQ